MSRCGCQCKPPVTKKGILIPADNSFEAINSFVHHDPSPHYEELQYALLGIACELEKYREGGVTEEILRRNDGYIKVGKGCVIACASEVVNYERKAEADHDQL